MKNFIKIAFLLFSFSVFNILASESNITIDSFEIVSDKAGLVTIKASGVNRSGKALCIAGAAKSNNGIIHSEAYIPNGVDSDTKSGKFTALVWINRPPGKEAKKTDILYLKVALCNDRNFNVITSKQFDWPYLWKPKIKSHTNFTETPYQILHEKVVSAEFETLDLLLDKWNSSKERGIDGDWKLSNFKYAVKSSCYVGEKLNWKKCLKRIEYWKTISPKTAGLAEARYWSDYAWHVRGGRYATNVDPYAVKLFSIRMKKAEKALKKVSSIKNSTPLWYEIYLDLSIDTKKDKKYIRKLFDASVKKYPAYLALYVSMVNYLANTSKSNDSRRELDNLINKATAYTFVMDGDSNYAKLYSELIYNQQHSKNIFKSTLVSWPKMKKSFDTMIAKYPSPDNLNRFAILACQANDKNTFLNLKFRLGKKIKPELWPHNYSIDLCQRKFMRSNI